MAIIKPDWPAPASVEAMITTRSGGVSSEPYDSLNLGDHVGDDPQAVTENRRWLEGVIPNSPYWLTQTHSTIVKRYKNTDLAPEGDASFSNHANQPCVVMTADCLPVLFCNAQGTQVAAAHAGWRGLLEGILENTVRTFSTEDQLYAYLGPAIGPDAFEVGEEVKEAFVSKDPDAEGAFKPSSKGGKWLADIYQLARLRLLSVGVNDVYGGKECTFTQADKYFSYRRDGKTGRMASVIWLK